MKYTIELFTQLENFQVQEMGANTVNKAEKFEKQFDAWKIANGFDKRKDADELAADFRKNLSATQLEKYYSL